MKKFLQEFKEFALRGNVMDMAIGIIIGGAFTGIVTSLTDNFINPVLMFITGQSTYSFSEVAGFGTAFISSVINFIITAFILFVMLRAVNKIMSIGKKPVQEEPATKICPYCKSEIAIDATRCPHCTSEL